MNDRTVGSWAWPLVWSGAAIVGLEYAYQRFGAQLWLALIALAALVLFAPFSRYVRVRLHGDQQLPDVDRRAAALPGELLSAHGRKGPIHAHSRALREPRHAVGARHGLIRGGRAAAHLCATVAHRPVHCRRAHAAIVMLVYICRGVWSVH